MWSAADPSTGEHGPEGLYGESFDTLNWLTEAIELTSDRNHESKGCFNPKVIFLL